MTSSLKPIGLFGGSFDPVHLGHLNLAKNAIDLIELEQVRFIPLNVPVHREASLTTIEDRLKMLQRALRPPFFLDETEINRGGVSYTVDTLRSFRDDNPTRSLCLLLGQDSFDQLGSWRSYDELLSIVNIVVAGRPNSLNGIPAHLKSTFESAVSESITSLHSQNCGVLYFLEAPLMDVSSTKIRCNVLKGESLIGLVPEEVAFFIERQNLYQS
jgi:nicotinate-nucleotide adenylyltransferase